MTALNELIRVESNGTISFGNYTLRTKSKLTFSYEGNSYKVKTYKDITKLECNDLFVYESVPGTAVWEFAKTDNNVSFSVEGTEGAQITLGLEPDTEYEVFVNKESVGVMSTNLCGKLSLSVEIVENQAVSISVTKR